MPIQSVKMAHQVAPGGKSGAPWRFSLFSCFGKCGTCESINAADGLLSSYYSNECWPPRSYGKCGSARV